MPSSCLKNVNLFISVYIEQLQRQTLKIIYPEINSKDALEQAKTTTPKNRREKSSQKLFSSIEDR
jgi:hypothetical protein